MMNLKLDNYTKKIMKYGIIFSFLVLISSIFVIFYYDIFYPHPYLYSIGILLFQAGTTYLFSFLFCGFAFTKIKQDLGQ